MSRWLIMSVMLVSFTAHAEIFVCKDGQDKITYQDKACATKTVRKLENIPEAPIEDQIRARERIDRSNESYRQYQAALMLERQQQQKIDLEYEALEVEKRKLELLENQSLISGQVVVPAYGVGIRPAYRGHEYKNRAFKSRAHNMTHNRRHGKGRFEK
jgi:hypothetical protein